MLMANKCDAPIRGVEPVCQSNHNDDTEKQFCDALGASQLHDHHHILQHHSQQKKQQEQPHQSHMTPPMPARRLAKPPNAKHAYTQAQTAANTRPVRSAKAPPMPFLDEMVEDDENNGSMAQFRSRFDAGEFFLRQQSGDRAAQLSRFCDWNTGLYKTGPKVGDQRNPDRTGDLGGKKKPTPKNGKGRENHSPARRKFLHQLPSPNLPGSHQPPASVESAPQRCRAHDDDHHHRQNKQALHCIALLIPKLTKQLAQQVAAPEPPPKDPPTTTFILQYDERSGDQSASTPERKVAFLKPVVRVTQGKRLRAGPTLPFLDDFSKEDARKSFELHDAEWSSNAKKPKRKQSASF